MDLPVHSMLVPLLLHLVFKVILYIEPSERKSGSWISISLQFAVEKDASSLCFLGPRRGFSDTFNMVCWTLCST